MHKRLFLLTILVTIIQIGSAVAGNPDELMLVQGCRACHVIGVGGGSLGPSLNGIGQRLNPHQLRLRLVTPKQLNPSTEMPDFSHLTEQDIEQLIRTLQQHH